MKLLPFTILTLFSGVRSQYPTEDLAPACPGIEWQQVYEVCQLKVNVPMSWTAARNHCGRFNSHLTILSERVTSVGLHPSQRNLTGEWVGLYVFNEKLWWDYIHPIAAKPFESRYNWSERPVEISENSHAVIARFTSNYSSDFMNITLEMVTDATTKPFTCFRRQRTSYLFEENEAKCRPSWISTRNLGYCLSPIMDEEDFESAKTHCRSLNASLWSPGGDYEITIIRKYLNGLNLTEAIHVGIYGEPRSERLVESHDLCPSLVSMDLVSDNCSISRKYLCQEPSKYSISKPKIKMDVKYLAKDEMVSSSGVLLINSSKAYSVALKCSLEPDTWIRNGVFGSNGFEKMGYDGIIYLKDFIDRTSFVPLNISLAQGTYSCSVHLDNFGYRTSNQVTVILKDVITSWLFLVLEVNIDGDFSQYLVDSHKKNTLIRFLDMKTEYKLLNETSSLYFDSIVKNRKIDQIPGKHLITWKFGLYTQITKSPISKYFIQHGLSGAREIQLKYFDEYAKEVKTNIIDILMDRMNSLSNLLLSEILFSDIPTRRKREIKFNEYKDKYGKESYGSFYIKNTRGCHSGSVNTPEGPIRFEAALAGEVSNSTSICPSKDAKPLALGLCNGSFVDGYHWEIVTFYRCLPSAKFQSEITDDLFTILNTMDTITEVPVIEHVENVTAKNYMKMTFVDVRLIAEIVQSAIKGLEVIDHENGQILADIVSNTMQAPVDTALDSMWEKEKAADSKFRLTKSMESFASNVKMDSPEATWSTKNLVVHVDQSSEEKRGFGLDIHEKDGEDVYINGEEVSEKKIISVGIIIPPEALNSVPRRRGPTKTSFIFYKKDSLLSNPNCQNDEGDTVPTKSFVIAASVHGVKISNLSDKIRLRFKIDKNTKTPSCAFIDEHQNGTWQWSTEGQQLEHFDNETGMVECLSDHLTNFAVLAGFCMHPDSKYAKVLTNISIIGMVLSITCLSLLILCQMFFKKFRKGQFQIALLNLSIALIAINLLVILGVDRTGNRIGCMVVAALLHYFLLAAFSWMLIEAILQYYKFVKVFNIHVSKFALKTVLPAWILPGLVIVVTATIDYNMFRGPKYYCWLRKDAFYYAFLLPLAVVVTINVLIFIRIIKGISCDRPKGMQTNQTKRRLVWLQVQVGMCCFVVMGLTWSFALFAFGGAALVMQFLFAIFNSLQGFFVFLLFNLREKQVRKAWFELLCSHGRGKIGAIMSSESGGFISKNPNRNKTDDVILNTSSNNNR